MIGPSEAPHPGRRGRRPAGLPHQRAEGRLFVLGLFFLCAFSVIGLRMGHLASGDPGGAEQARRMAPPAVSRAEITDRQGRILATDIAAHALYAEPQKMIDPERVARELAALLPGLDAERLVRDFTGPRSFMWLRDRLSPEQVQAVRDIGDPGLLFAPRELRFYPNGAVAAHVLGGVRFENPGVHSADVVGIAGLEMALEPRLQEGAPLALSLDLGVQATVERVLAGGMTLLGAKGAAAVLMEVATGEIVALASLPDFDPNDRPLPLTSGDPAQSPLFNRAVQGVYELGSVFKILTMAQALELGLVTPDTMVETAGPLRWGRFAIRDFHNYGPRLSATQVIVKSSNIGTARIAQQIGPERQRAFLRELGLLDPPAIELVEARQALPLAPAQWSELSAMTISYGHGLSVSPVHLAAAFATVLGDGRLVRPTLIHGAPRDLTPRRIVSPATTETMRQMMRAVVTEGTASMAEVAGYRVGGKTGTANKPRPGGGYFEDRVIATFAGVFPADAPRYVLIVSLDEPVETSGTEPRRTAGWTAVPVAAEIIRRIAPQMGMRPEIEPDPDLSLSAR